MINNRRYETEWKTHAKYLIDKVMTALIVFVSQQLQRFLTNDRVAKSFSAFCNYRNIS